MGRRKLEIKRIEDKGSRLVTFCKRRNGLMEKARQLSVLCGSSVAIIVVSSTGKLYSSSSGDSMAKILKRYEIQRANDLKTLDLTEKISNSVSLKELLKVVQCAVEDVNVKNVSEETLNSLEEQLEAALSVTRDRKAELTMKLVKSLEEKEKLLSEENKMLSSQLTKMEKNMCMEPDNERATPPENSSDDYRLETLPLLK